MLTTQPHVDTTVNIDPSDRIKCKILDDHQIQLDHKKCEWFLELKTFRGERDVTETHVQELYDHMAKGRFRPELVVIATCKLENEDYRINGQHTCWARLNIPANYQCVVRWVQYEVDTQEQLRRLYCAFDTNKTRTPGHRVKALLAGTDSVDGVWDSTLATFGAGIRLWLWEKQDERRRNGADEIAKAMVEHQRLLKGVSVFFQQYGTEQTHIKRAAVIAAMFATFNKVPTKAVEFWGPVAHGLHLDNMTDPRYKLREYLRTSAIKAGFLTDKKRTVSAEEMYRICIIAWNKWRAGEPAKSSLRSTSRRISPI